MDFIREIINALKKLINNENYLNLISIFVVAVTTYYVAKYNTLKPNKLKIKQQQLDNVYLPLFQLFGNMTFPISKKSALSYSKKLNSVLEQNYVLTFPGLHNLNKELKAAILSNEDYSKILKLIKHQVDIDYELLKKSLGYPSQNWYDLFIRMTFKQKAQWIISWVNVFAIFSPILFMCYFVKLPQAHTIPILVVAYMFIFFVLMKLNSYIDNIKD
nr:MAG TPA: hypothetical protein [Caudoviricetes sp.]